MISELALVLTADRLDAHSRAVITDEYERVLNLSSCPVDRSAELCGRLTPGDELQLGERLVNAQGEVLCMGYDGAARHIGVDGTEVYTSAGTTRGGEDPLIGWRNGAAEVKISGRRFWGQGDRFRLGRRPSAIRGARAGQCVRRLGQRRNLRFAGGLDHRHDCPEHERDDRDGQSGHENRTASHFPPP